MKTEFSTASALTIYVIGVAAGSLFGFVAGILFVVVACLIHKLMAKKEKEIDHPNSTTTDKTDPSNDGNEPYPSYQA